MRALRALLPWLLQPAAGVWDAQQLKPQVPAAEVGEGILVGVSGTGFDVQNDRLIVVDLNSPCGSFAVLAGIVQKPDGAMGPVTAEEFIAMPCNKAGSAPTSLSCGPVYLPQGSYSVCVCNAASHNDVCTELSEFSTKLSHFVVAR